jgi:hypothetical protein
MAERFSLPDKWFEYSVVEGVDEGKPGIYYWLIEGGDSYIGKYSSIDRPKKHYGRIVERSINLKPYRKSNPKAFVAFTSHSVRLWKKSAELNFAF